MTKIKPSFIAYYSYSLLSLLVCGILTFINLFETIDQLNGKYTIFNQISTMTDREILLYCIFVTIVFIISFIFLVKFILKNNWKKAVITSTINWTIIFIMFCIEHITNSMQAIAAGSVLIWKFVFLL
jgi:hypothetical protein